MPVICGRDVSDEDIRNARGKAELYLSRGFSVLPSMPSEKRPMVKYADYWEARAPSSLLDENPTTNLQLILGRFHRVLVVDVDKPEAQAEWRRWPQKPRTWVTHSGGDGQHWWFRLPKDYPTPLPYARLWQGDAKHTAIERLCDRSLIVIPPSIHPETGERYRFLYKHDPKTISAPAMCPQWILDKPPLVDPSSRPEWTPETRRKAPVALSGRHHAAEDVLDAIPDKVALAQSWGLRIAGTRPSPTGWMSCRAFDREDERPSAAIHVRDGNYVDRGSNLSLSFFYLGMAMGQFGSYVEAVDALGDEYAR